MAKLRTIIRVVLLLCAARTLPAQIGTPRTLDSLFGCADVVAAVEPIGDGLSDRLRDVLHEFHPTRNTDDPVIATVVIRAFKGCAAGDTICVRPFSGSNRHGAQFLLFLRTSSRHLLDELRRAHCDTNYWRAFLHAPLYRTFPGTYSIANARGEFNVDYVVTPLPDRVSNTPVLDESYGSDYRAVKAADVFSVIDSIAGQAPPCRPPPDVRATASGVSDQYQTIYDTQRAGFLPLALVPPSVVDAAEALLRKRVGDKHFGDVILKSAISSTFIYKNGRPIELTPKRDLYWIVVELQRKEVGLDGYLSILDVGADGKLIAVDLPDIAHQPWIIDSLIPLARAREFAGNNGAPKTGLLPRLVYDPEFRSFAWCFSWYTDPDEEEGMRWMKVDAYTLTLLDRGPHNFGR
jgi:hypothetical protein